MRRRDFLGHGLSLGIAGAAGGAITRSLAAVPAHNWDRYNFGPGPQVFDRLNQGPFSQYVQDATIPADEVVMATTASAVNVPNFGRGLITYITADMGLQEIKADHALKAIEDLARFPLGQLLYVRPTWRELQPTPGLRRRARRGRYVPQRRCGFQACERFQLPSPLRAGRR